MKRMLTAIVLVLFLLTGILSAGYQVFSTPLLISLAITAGTTFYHFAMRLGGRRSGQQLYQEASKHKWEMVFAKTFGRRAVSPSAGPALEKEDTDFCTGNLFSRKLFASADCADSLYF